MIPITVDIVERIGEELSGNPEDEVEFLIDQGHLGNPTLPATAAYDFLTLRGTTFLVLGEGATATPIYNTLGDEETRYQVVVSKEETGITGPDSGPLPGFVIAAANGPVVLVQLPAGPGEDTK